MNEQKIAEIEAEIAKTKYNKATQGHIGKLKAKLARLKESGPGGGGGGGYSFSVKKTGDATVVMVGFPSVGKSTLINRITNADSKVAAYEFTTLSVIPGMMEYNNAKIQVLDIPGVISEASQGKGRGREVMAAARNADLILMIAAGKTIAEINSQFGVIESELYKAGFRLDTKRPDIRISKRNTGGININSTVRLRMGKEEIVEMLKEFGIMNADVLIREEVTEDKLIDHLLGNRVYVPTLRVINKVDLAGAYPPNAIPISALKDRNIEELKEAIWNRLGLMRVYLKKIGKEPDLKEPMMMKRDSTVAELCRKIHRRFGEDFRFARVWGSSKFEGQKVGEDYRLRDRDIVEIHNR